jgi:hypothetical protein
VDRLLIRDFPSAARTPSREVERMSYEIKPVEGTEPTEVSWVVF